ncbi:hypothetical protein C8R45DRAFT_1144505 [Mycena sanguinolenta]|nr:hypothetical protein C8R45DRAFT_1144505 [Mycena sanguinolenta]
MSPRMHTPTAFDSRIPDLIKGLAIPSTIFIGLLLCAFASIAWKDATHINRVSFRLLVYALISNLAYAVGMINGTTLKPGAACNGETFFSDCCLMFAGVMFFCMALNLQLVLVHGANGQKMEKWYILGAILLTLGCNIPPYAAGALGYWDLNDTCWYNSPDPQIQLAWWMGTQAFWMYLMSAGEVISFLTILGFMIFRHRVRSVMSGSISSMAKAPLPKPPIILYRKIILRIGLYPLVSCFLNITGATLDLHTILDPVNTEVNWRLGIVDLLVYSLRPLLYAMLAATDPSFLRAIRALRARPEALPDRIPVNVTLGCDTATTWSTGSTTQNGQVETGMKPEEEEDAAVPVFTCQI